MRSASRKQRSLSARYSPLRSEKRSEQCRRRDALGQQPPRLARLLTAAKQIKTHSKPTFAELELPSSAAGRLKNRGEQKTPAVATLLSG
jgi:hypothetical protein